MKRFFSHLVKASPRGKKGFISRIVLALTLCSVLGFALNFVSTPAAHACGGGSFRYADVYDSYNHWEGVISLIHDDCSNGWAGEFVSNTNTWRSVTVYVEYAHVLGYLQGGPYGWKANYPFDSPWYHGNSCYYAEVDLIDNRGIQNWVGTTNAGPGGVSC